MIRRRLIFFTAATVITLGVLFFINPENARFMPKCPLYAFTGIECPACGTQRALHRFLHFDFRGAFGYNPFLVISLPYVFSVLAVHVTDRKYLVKLRKFCFHPTVVNTYLALILLWWIGRNVFL